MSYSVQSLAKIAGVSVRTLHHYDDVGLLNPVREKNGYRTYREDDLLRLQQILFFRELEFPLEEIRSIMSNPSFDMKTALKEHRKLIEIKRKRMNGLLKTIDKTLLKLSHKSPMKDEDLYGNFTKEESEAYAKEAKERWGHTDAYKQSMERTKHFTKEDYQRMAKDADKYMNVVKDVMKHGPTSAEAQKLIAQHYESLRTFYDPNPEMYRGLGQMYVDDPRFRKFYEKYDPQMPEFMRDAMHAYCDTLEKAA